MKIQVSYPKNHNEYIQIPFYSNGRVKDDTFYNSWWESKVYKCKIYIDEQGHVIQFPINGFHINVMTLPRCDVWYRKLPYNTVISITTD